jgi:hypothetical protein
MDGKGSIEATERSLVARADGVNAPRKRRNGNDVNLRYFLMKPGSSPARPELGQEMASEGEALIEAFRTGQPFYTVTAWKAVPEVNGASPVIVKQAVAPKTI